MKNKEPFVQAALLCEKILRDHDGVVSVIRIVDRIALHIPQNIPEGVEGAVDINLLVSLKSGGLKGKSKIVLHWEKPSGASQQLGDTEVDFRADETHGINLITNIKLVADEFGLHWFHIHWNAKRITSVPFTLVKAEG